MTRVERGPTRISVGLVSSWPRDIARGSGTARFLLELTGALQRSGVDVVDIGVGLDLDPQDSEFAHRRFSWNEALANDPSLRDLDALLAIDYDGYALPEGSIPRVVCPQGIFAELANTEPEPSRSALLSQARAERRNVQAAAVVVVPSAFAASAIVRHYGVDPAKVRTIPHGFDSDAWGRLVAAAPRKESAGSTVLSVAKLYPRKGIDTLLRAIALLRPRRPDLRARIVGGGVEAGRLAALAEDLDLGDSAVFLGDVSDRAALAREFRRADLFCLPSRLETFGFVFVEAMSIGLPVVAADAGAAPEVLGEAGLLVPPDDPGRLAAALDELLTDSESRGRRGRAGLLRAARFQWDTSAAMYHDVLKAVMS
jgi:glycosyltransferase involved in cell wall biosynthesis